MSGNNQAYAAGEIGMTFNGVSLYYSLLKSPDPKLQAIAADTFTQDTPFGFVASASRIGGADQCDGVQAHQIPERGQGIHSLHDGEGSVRAVAVELPWLLVPAAEGLSAR